MASTSGTSSSSSLNNLFSNNRMSGLMSGLDTENLVKSMAMNTKNRLNKQKQKLQTLQWKQEGYRDIISKISSFQEKYLSISSSSSIKANAVMNKFKAECSNDKVTASATSSAVPATYYIKEAKSATKAVLSSSEEGCGSIDKVELDFSKNKRNENYTVKFTFDGTTKEIKFNSGASMSDAKESFLASVNREFSKSLGENQSFKFDGNNLVFDKGNEVGITHIYKVGYNSEAVGLANEASSMIERNTELGRINFNYDLGNQQDFKFSINGVDFSFKNTTTVGEVVNTINQSEAGVKLTFSSVTQSFTLESLETGKAGKIDIKQTQGNLANALFNLGTDELGNLPASSAFLFKQVDFVTKDLDTTLTAKFKSGLADSEKNMKLNLKIDSEDETELILDLSALQKSNPSAADFTDEQIANALNNAMQAALTAKGFNSGDVTLNYANDKLTIQSDKRVFTGDNDFGLGTVTNKRNVNPSAGDVIAEGVTEMKFKEADGTIHTVTAQSGSTGITVNDLAASGLFSYSNGRLTALKDFSAEDSAATDFLTAKFLTSDLHAAKNTTNYTKYGDNGTIKVSTDGVNYRTYTSASNDYTFDGTTINITKLKDFTAATSDEEITITTSKDNSSIKDAVKNFVEDYNKLLADVYKSITTKRPKSKGEYYDPLTEEQEEEMSKEQIEKWEENAKTGLLYQDNYLNTFVNSIRSALITSVEGFNLYKMGIDTSKELNDHGKLILNESKLDAAIEAHGDEIAKLFTDPDKGIASRLTTAVDKAIQNSNANNKYGYLTKLAGIENTTSEKKSSMYSQINSLQKLIDNMQDKYEREMERYWKKFTALETLMAKMQQQSSYFESDY